MSWEVCSAARKKIQPPPHLFQHGIKNKNWHFIAGSKAEIYGLARQSYFAEEELGYTKDSTEFLHTEHCILVDRNKRIRGIYNGTLVLDMQQLLEDILVLRQEHGENYMRSGRHN